MNAPLRRVAITVFVLFGLLFANLNYVQVIQGDSLRNDERNERVRISNYERARGTIVVEGQAVALSKETSGKYKYQRQYPAGELYAAVTGYQSLVYGNTGIEAAENGVLNGDADELFVRRVSDMITGRKPRGGNVVLTLDREVQAQTAKSLRGRAGSAIALDPRTGEILALVTSPGYDPNPFASHQTKPQKDAFTKLNAAPTKPLLDRALNQTYPPGSTFKVVMSAALIERGYQADTEVDAPRSYDPPQTTALIRNFGGSACGDGRVTLAYALQVSCNTVFAKLGVEQVKADGIKEKARQFGFENSDLTVPMKVSPSQLGPITDPPAVAQSSIGQRDVRMTPLQGAMIAAAVANNGTLMQPYLVKEIQAPDYTNLKTTSPKTLSEPLNPTQAGELQKMMRAVVEDGTGTRARIQGATVGGKTGTAEDGDERQDHEWFIGWAIVDGQAVAAVAVVLENAGTSSSQAASVAGDIMTSVISQRGPK